MQMLKHVEYYVFYVNLLCGSLLLDFGIVNSIIPKIYLKEKYICIVFPLCLTTKNAEI